MAQGGSNKKVANSLVSASCAAVLAVYVAGYARTESAANRFAGQVAERRVAPTIRMPNESPYRKISRVPVPPPEAYMSGPSAAAPVLPHPKRDRPGKAPAILTAEAAPAPVRLPGAMTEPAAGRMLSGPIAATPTASATILPAAPVATPPAEHPAEVAVVAPAVSPAPPPAPTLPPAAPPAPQWKDGTYTGWGFSRHGNIEAEVVIANGRIASALISQCRTRYSCSVIDRLPPQVAQRQSPDVDYVSGATQSADAFYGAVLAALNKAK